jgi:lincosamide nucleotidyltransferase A/C/D/E
MAASLLNMMTSKDVVQLYTMLNDSGVEVWIDGGWGVDALLGAETRPHKDLDIAAQQKDIPKLRELLEAKAYKDIPQDDTSPWNFVLGDGRGREVDVHVIAFDVDGNGLYGPVEKGAMYPAASLKGVGRIGNLSVRCISPEWMIKFHIGYDPGEKDFRDVSALCNKFKIDLPAEYKRFQCRS